MGRTTTTRDDEVPGPSELWVALLEVRGASGQSAATVRNGAFVNVVARAVSRGDFMSTVGARARELGLDIMKIEDAEPLRTRRAAFVIPPELDRLVREAATTSNPVFGTFFTWPAE